MLKAFFVVMLTAVGGCLTVTEPEVSRWPMAFALDRPEFSVRGKPDRGVLRLMQVSVRSPYDGVALVVLREDGTVASDPYNEFAAAPSSLLKGVTIDALLGCGRFSQVVPASSIAATKLAAEVHVSRLCLDCREPDSRRAVCEIRVRLLNDRDIDQVLVGEGEASAEDGNFGKAFSTAVSKALATALSKLD